MKKIVSLILLMFIMSCHYSPNRIINKRTPPVIIIAINPEKNSIVLRDGDNKVFTIYKTPTTNALNSSLKEGDTVRNYIRKSNSGNF